MVGVKQRYSIRCVLCLVPYIGLLLQDDKYVKAEFPLTQQKKSQDGTHLLFCIFRTVTDTVFCWMLDKLANTHRSNNTPHTMFLFSTWTAVEVEWFTKNCFVLSEVMSCQFGIRGTL